MPRKAANRFAPIVAALQWDRGRWIWLLLILVLLGGVLGLGDSISALFRYDRSAIAAGGWWWSGCPTRDAWGTRYWRW